MLVFVGGPNNKRRFFNSWTFRSYRDFIVLSISLNSSGNSNLIVLNSSSCKYYGFITGVVMAPTNR